MTHPSVGDWICFMRENALKIGEVCYVRHPIGSLGSTVPEFITTEGRVPSKDVLEVRPPFKVEQSKPELDSVERELASYESPEKREGGR